MPISTKKDSGVTESNITNIGKNTEEIFEQIFFPMITSVGHQKLIKRKTQSPIFVIKEMNINMLLTTQ